MSRRRLFLIDGYSNIFRAFYAIRNLSNAQGLPTNAVYGFLQMLRKLVRDQSPELIGIAFDVSDETTKRKEKYEEYKANRAPMPEDLIPQIPWIRKTIEAHHIPLVELEGYEADDVIGTLAKKAAAAGLEVVVVSADKDLMQLVDDRVSVLHTGRDKLYDPALVEEDFGVPPEKIVDLLALKGDSVDNVPGVAGIGEKGAQALIREFGSLEALLERSDEVKRKSYREGLQQHREEALLSQELVTLHTDLPIDFDAEAFRHQPADGEALRELYRELGFSSLLAEVEATLATTAGAAAHTEPQGAELEVESVQSASAWRRAAKALVEGDLYVDLLIQGAALGLVVGGSKGTGYWADFRHTGLRDAVVKTVAGWLANDKRQVIGHDLKELLRWLDGAEPPRAELFDTMLASYLARPELRSQKFGDVCLERLHHKPLTLADAGWEGDDEPLPDAEGILRLAGERIDLLRRLQPILAAELETGKLLEVFRRIEEPLIPVLVQMEEFGVLLDVDRLATMSDELAEEMGALEAQIYDIAGESFNLNSPRQLGVVLFEKLGYPVLKKTRKSKSYSTSAEVLQELEARGYPLPERLLRFRELSKLKSTYVDALPALTDADGRLHTRFHQAVAATGRLSSASPNLQNIPIRTERGRRVRQAFGAPGGKLLLVADYSQIELRVLAHVADEPALIEAFRQGEDIHCSTAATVFGVMPELVTSEQRRAAKVINFGILYGMSAFGLARNLGIDNAEADEFIKAYLGRYQAVKRYMDETLETAKRDGRVETLYGRVRTLPDIHSKNFNLRENARRMAINARIQGTAADILKLAMIAVDCRLRKEHPQAHLILTVHDELVLEVPKVEPEAVADLVKTEMEGVAELKVPLEVDVGWGPNWDQAKA